MNTGEEKSQHQRPLVTIDADQVRKLLSEITLIEHLQSAISDSRIHCPQRINFAMNQASTDVSMSPPSGNLLLMPCWSESQNKAPYIGVKVVAAYPNNTSKGLPGVHASYILLDVLTGKSMAFIDGTELTHWRTSCLSALAASYLARTDSKVFLMVGSGQLAPYLIRAHVATRPSLKKIILWNRTQSRARSLAEDLRGKLGTVEVETCEDDLDCIVGSCDVICCATGSTEPLVHGKFLRPGTHLDLVGSFCSSMRECDEEALVRSRVFVDWKGALEEAGELVGAFTRGVLSPQDVAGTLAELVSNVKDGRRCSEELTVFKSVGSAAVDLITAQYVYEKFCQYGA